MFLFIPKAKEQCSLCNTSFLSENTKSHTHTHTHIHTHTYTHACKPIQLYTWLYTYCMYLFDMLPKTQFMLPPASTLGKRRLVVIWLHSNSEERKEERNRGRNGSFPLPLFSLIPPSLCHIPPFHLPYPSFHLLPILHSPHLPPPPPSPPCHSHNLGRLSYPPEAHFSCHYCFHKSWVKTDIHWCSVHPGRRRSLDCVCFWFWSHPGS